MGRVRFSCAFTNHYIYVCINSINTHLLFSILIIIIHFIVIVHITDTTKASGTWWSSSSSLPSSHLQHHNQYHNHHHHHHHYTFINTTLSDHSLSSVIQDHHLGAHSFDLKVWIRSNGRSSGSGRNSRSDYYVLKVFMSKIDSILASTT